MHILVTGGTGFIGSALCPVLLEDGHRLTILTRRPQKVFAAYGDRIKAIKRFDELDDNVVVDAVINLAGEGIADRPWTPPRKAELHASRVTLTEELVDWLSRSGRRPGVMISGSAVGWYGAQGEALLEEDAPAHEDYLHGLCADWEKAARGVETLGVRLCIVRTGLVLGKSGGMLKRMLPIFGLGLGGRLGSGEQWLSWITLSDYVAAVRFLLERKDVAGVFNLTAPRPETNADFTRTLARILKRPAIIPIPAPVLTLAMGEMSCLLLTGQRVLPSHLLSSGFSFRYRTLDEALRAEIAA